jgi:hypothetical protein
MTALLDRDGVYAAMLATATPLRSTASCERLDLTREDLPRFDTFGIGWGLGDDGAERSRWSTTSPTPSRWAVPARRSRPSGTASHIGVSRCRTW